MRKKIFAVSLLFCLWFDQLAVFAQEQRGAGNVKVKNEDTGKTEEVKLYKASYALVIGVSDYTNGWQKLPGVKDDARAVAEALKTQGFTVTSVINPTRGELQAAIEKFINDYGYDYENRLLIYYAGHGHTQKSGAGYEQGFIVPTDAPLPTAANQAEFRRLAISMDSIERYAQEIDAKHALFVFDSCFSGALITKTRSSIPPIITVKTTQPVRQFITAGADDQEVPDVSEFRKQFVLGIGGEADRNGDGFVTGSELADFLQDKVTRYTRGAQTPQYGKIRDARLDKGDFVFTLAKANAEKIPVQPSPSPLTEITARNAESIEREAWSSISNSSDAADFRDFLESFPNGKYAGQARIKLEQTSWDAIKTTKEKAKLEKFIGDFPSGANVGLAKLRLKQLERETAVVTRPTPAVESSSTTTTSSPMKGATMKRQIANGVEMEFVGIPAGSFKIGSPASEKDRYDDEGPQKDITIAKGFWLGKYEVTQAEYEKVLGVNPSSFKNCPRCPVESVTWKDAKAFIAKLNEKNDGFLYSLPSEAEWEYAMRAGTTTRFYWGDDKNYTEVGNYAWYNGNSDSKTHEVGLKLPNNFGLYDMSGNVWEWTEDVWVANHNSLSADGSPNLSGGDSSIRVLRGGSWDYLPRYVRSAVRNFNSGAYYDFGFRVAVRVK